MARNRVINLNGDQDPARLASKVVTLFLSSICVYFGRNLLCLEVGFIRVCLMRNLRSPYVIICFNFGVHGVESMWHLELSSNESYPERPDAVNCVYYMRTGFCRYGSRCRYNHPRDRAAVSLWSFKKNICVRSMKVSTWCDIVVDFYMSCACRHRFYLLTCYWLQ